MRQFLKDLAFVVHRCRANVESTDSYIQAKANRDWQNRVLDLQERHASVVPLILAEAKAQTLALSRIASALEQTKKSRNKAK